MILAAGAARPNHELADRLRVYPLDGLADTDVLELRVADEAQLGARLALLLDLDHWDILVLRNEVLEVVEVDVGMDLPHDILEAFFEAVVWLHASVWKV